MTQWILDNSKLVVIAEICVYRRDIEFDIGTNMKPKRGNI
jgi:hypothetical protein